MFTQEENVRKIKTIGLLFVLICLIGCMFVACDTDKEVKSFEYYAKPATSVYYDSLTNSSTVRIVFITTNTGDAPLTAVRLGCFFVDEDGNRTDTKESTFEVYVEPDYNTESFSLVFENVAGKPSTVEIYSAVGTYGMTQSEEREAWLKENWWIWIIVAYAVVGIAIGVLCGIYLCVDFDGFDETWLLTILCGLFWPVGGIILLVQYVKDSKVAYDGDEEYDEDEEYDFDEEYDEEETDDCDNENYHSRNRRNENSNGSIPKIKMSDIAGLNDAKEAFNDRVILPIKHKKLFAKYGKQVGGGILLYGLPGTGKTMFAQAVANELKASFFSVKCSDILSKWYGESESNVKQLFAKARKEPVSVIFFDEFEAIGAKRKESPFPTNISTVQEILAQMQGVEKSKNTLLVLAATNCPWNIDGALLRPGRFNEKIYVPLPDKEARLFILKKELSKVSLAEDVSMDEIADRLDNYNGSDVSEFCEQCKLAVIKKELSKERAVLDREDVEAVLNKVHSSVLEEDVEKMEEFRENNGL